ncbi:MAG: hypothetical protein GXP27_18330 [Planctomycetes bacterium]|nr:hypothetical protein [Planctomycetota bacterium]
MWYVSDLGDSEQTPSDLATVTDYAQLTALRAPRPTLLTFNASDQCCFRAGHALPPLLDAAVPIYELYGQRDALRYHINYDPGTHNFERDNREAFYRMLGDFFYLGDKQFDWREIPSEAEVKTAEELNVPLPADNRDFHALAVQLSRSLPVKPARGPSAQQPLADWQRDRRQVLRKLVRVTEADVRAERVKEEAMPGGRVVLWKLEVADTWTVPAVELIPDRPRSAALVFADSGRKATTEHVAALLHAGRRVVAIDPFYLGESKITQRDFLYALLVAAIGERPLGIQASQVAAIARWMAKDRDIGAVELVAVGRRSSLAAMVAAALEEKAIGHVTLWDGLLTLKEIIDRDLTVREAPELFCFGLLAQFDVPQLVALITPRTVRFSRTSPVASAPAGSSQNPRSPRP